VRANDRRFIIPIFAKDFEVNFCFSSKSNVQVKCVDQEWTTILHIKIPKKNKVLIYARTSTKEEGFSAQGLELNKEGSVLVSNTQTNKAEAKGKLLKVNITEGQIIPLNQFDKALTLFVTNKILKKEKR
jgi:flagella basal body P-ring formation protein FlgA